MTAHSDHVTENLTIIIPTYNRYSHIARWLKYWSMQKNPPRVIIADATPAVDRDEPYIDLLTKTPMITYTQHNDQSTFWGRVLACKDLLETPFYALCADDDFITESAQIECTKFLREHPDYVGVHGWYYGYNLIPKFLGGREMAYGSLYPKHKDLLGGSVEERMKNVFLKEEGGPTIYGMFRSEELGPIWQSVADFSTNYSSFETCALGNVAIRGKVKLLPLLYSLRQMNEKSWITTNNFEQFHNDDELENLVKAWHATANLVSQSGSLDETFRVCARKHFDLSEVNAVFVSSFQQQFRKKFEKYYRQYVRLGRRHFLRPHFGLIFPDVSQEYLEAAELDVATIAEVILKSDLSVTNLAAARETFLDIVPVNS